MKRTLTILMCSLALVSAAQNYSIAHPPILPDPKLTPGDVFTNVTVEQICTKGYANVLNGGVRNVPESLKRKVFFLYFGRVPDKTEQFEVDHVISLELSGANTISNLFPQSYLTYPWNAHVKDRLENRLAALVRAELKTNGPVAATAMLKQFQQEISGNWTNSYLKHLGKPR